MSVAVVVDPVEGVILRAPPALEHGKIDALVRRKGAWIVRQLRSFEDLLPAPSKREFVSGELFWYLGRQLRLRVEVTDQPPAGVGRSSPRRASLRQPLAL